ncbi:hypothetical protein ZIOFF_041434 [Zingiber officinale]|uniref:C2 domain-containing protein n=1 Tax=Zingiber officinale TaxID=94328 RepID=A0A8J5GHE5_ZINOF|nr:hypothetical protein ZIOFF_041434 [Zingiber officinale]
MKQGPTTLLKLRCYFKILTLAVETLKADDLKLKTRNGSVNPFVSLEFRGKRRRTATKLYSLSPCWDETLLFPVADPLDLPQSTIEVSVYHDNSNFNSTAQHRNSFLGRVSLSGSSVAPCRLDVALQLCPLDKRSFFSNTKVSEEGRGTPRRRQGTPRNSEERRRDERGE